MALSACNAFVDLDAVELENTTPGACDPIAQTGCEEGFICLFSFTGKLSPVCSRSAGVQLAGATCDNAELACAPGLQCVNWPAELDLGQICSPICVRSSGNGCESGETCVNHFGEQLETYGFCVAECRPGGMGCGVGSSCEPDPYVANDSSAGNVCLLSQ